MLCVASTWLAAQTVTSSIQGRVYDASGGDLKKVVDYICDEAGEGLPVQASSTHTAN